MHHLERRWILLYSLTFSLDANTRTNDLSWIQKFADLFKHYERILSLTMQTSQSKTSVCQQYTSLWKLSSIFISTLELPFHSNYPIIIRVSGLVVYTKYNGLMLAWANRTLLYWIVCFTLMKAFIPIQFEVINAFFNSFSEQRQFDSILLSSLQICEYICDELGTKQLDFGVRNWPSYIFNELTWKLKIEFEHAGELNETNQKSQIII